MLLGLNTSKFFCTGDWYLASRQLFFFLNVLNLWVAPSLIVYVTPVFTVIKSE